MRDPEIPFGGDVLRFASGFCKMKTMRGIVAWSNILGYEQVWEKNDLQYVIRILDETLAKAQASGASSIHSIAACLDEATGLSKGRAYKLVKVDDPSVTIRVINSDVVIPVDATDLLRRIELKQRGLNPEELDEEEATEEEPSGDGLGKAWHFVEQDGEGIWRRRSDSQTFDVELRKGYSGFRFVAILYTDGRTLCFDRAQDVDAIVHVRRGKGPNSYTYFVDAIDRKTIIGHTGFGNSSDSWNWHATIER